MIAAIAFHWLFLAILSAVATTLLIVLSWEMFGGIHSSLVMAVRVLGVVAIILPIIGYVAFQGKTGINNQTTSFKSILFLIGIALSAGVSWVSYYSALEYGKQSGASAALITAINYSSVALVFLVSWSIGRQVMDWRGLVGTLLVVAGILMVSLVPKSQPNPSQSVISGEPR